MGTTNSSSFLKHRVCLVVSADWLGLSSCSLIKISEATECRTAWHQHVIEHNSLPIPLRAVWAVSHWPGAVTAPTDILSGGCRGSEGPSRPCLGLVSPTLSPTCVSGKASFHSVHPHMIWPSWVCAAAPLPWCYLLVIPAVHCRIGVRMPQWVLASGATVYREEARRMQAL